MSDLTHALQTERPSRKLCLEAKARIEHLEDVLIECQKIAYGMSSDTYANLRSAVEEGLRQPKRTT